MKLAGPVWGSFSHHRSKFPSEKFLEARNFSLCPIILSGATLTRSNFLDAARIQAKPPPKNKNPKPFKLGIIEKGDTFNFSTKKYFKK
ncbi:MAG: hypothetical protein COX40_03280 [Candidatus Omnitrophica bacterium CG23_combo_of_CG06-09_8_20_14_all_40_11]|nr:MAG: hypothetical protein COX40_03280 [Candidatus Omnitrophica bacterium CG23_combo_of_CG06-09_8_20_14_all_40_11]